MTEQIYAVTRGVEGRARCGKSYSEGVEFAIWWLRQKGNAVFWTSIPLYVDKIAEYCNVSKEYAHERIKLIPKEEIVRWKHEQSGPWEFFKGKDITGSHIKIDEVHKVCNTAHKKDHIKNWSDWLGELGHNKARFSGISQAFAKFHKRIRDEMEVHVVITNLRNRKVPLLGILMWDFYMLLHCCFLPFPRGCQIVHRVLEPDGKFKAVDTRICVFDKKLFKLYDSFSAPIGEEDHAKVSDIKEEYELYSRPVLFLRVIMRNKFALLSSLFVLYVLYWLLTGGLGRFIGGAIDIMGSSSSHMQRTSEPENILSGQLLNEESGMIEADTSTLSIEDSATLALEDSKTAMLHRLDTLQKTIDAMIERQKLESGLTAILPKKAYFRDGQVLQIGDSFNGGYWHEKTVQQIDPQRRCVVLDDGTRLLLDGVQ